MTNALPVHWIGTLPPLHYVALATAFFFTIYWTFAFAGLFCTRVLFPAAGLGRRLDARLPRPGQVRAEIGWSMLSVLVFGAGSLAVWWGVHTGLFGIASGAPWTIIAIECALLILWNDLHFYACHWLLHRKALFPRFHIQHHRSHVVTPFATYSFHPVEAMLLGSVMPAIMPFHAFSAEALLFLPVYSLLVNTMGHSNYDLFPARRTGQLTTFSRRHQMHHAKFHGNYGFMLPWLDALFRTRVVDMKPAAAG